VTPERWLQVERLLHAALDRAPAERRSFIEKACAGDPALRTEVESLLAAHDERGSFLTAPAVNVMAQTLALDAPRRAVGDSIGPYRLEAPLGGGGMGDVWRARDKSLGRDVAIKFLAPGFADDAKRMLRFEQEARAVAQLNHPNILTIHAVSTEGDAPYLVTELLEGETLQAHLGSGALPIDRVLDYAMQLTQGLVAAHEKGIVHRDLKPSNLFVTRDGRIKILDFGLAKVTRPLEGWSDPTQTTTGAILGTMGYMSPEQATGRSADHRSDLFAAGAILYEMLSGRRAFAGETPFMTLDATIASDPPPLTDVPPDVDRIVRRCVEKRPEDRFQSARELAADLEAARTALAKPARVDNRRARWWIAAPLAASVVGVVAWTLLRERRPPPSGRLVQVFSSDREAADPAISPDGMAIVYAASDEAGRIDLFVRRVAGGDPVRLTNDDARESQPEFSPDGGRVAFARWESRAISDVCVVPAFGGQVSVAVRAASHPAWAPDGKRIAFIRLVDDDRRVVLATASTDGTDTRDLVSAGRALSLRSPAWSPDGRSIAFVQGSGGVAGEIWMVNAEGGAPRRLSTDSGAVFSDEPAFSRDGRAIVHASNRGGSTNIWALPIAGGPAVRLTNGPGPDQSPSVDSTGRVAFINSRWRNELIVADLRTANTRTLFRHAPFLWAPAFAPSGGAVAYSRSEVDGSWHVWVNDLDGGAPRQVTRTDNGEVYPRWMPDGGSLIYHNWESPRRIWKVARDGGPPAALTPEGRDAAYGDVSPDGRLLAFVTSERSEERVLIQRLGDETAARVLRAAPTSLPRWSPDGTWIAFARDRSFAGGIFIVRPDGTGERRLTDSGGWPVWWPDGRRIAYLKLRPDNTQQIETVALDGTVTVAPVPIRYTGFNDPFDIARSGELLTTTNGVHVSSEIWVLEPGS
jgi:eukaryotic-like serine/threonine-protein kinase